MIQRIDHYPASDGLILRMLKVLLLNSDEGWIARLVVAAAATLTRLEVEASDYHSNRAARLYRTLLIPGTKRIKEDLLYYERGYTNEI